ncbi:thiamine-phosphate kinase [Herbidospora galbida]|uniref:Thiamine-monophosphate kinase n=1 Tax=Herbidospora galbida TaxID=2575442 RepID=A0A4U3M0N3_9ACTN|nr:thiamine-phosphate kinase [Herbidospora galbida]TKK80816.1 thiamine-phosphate kinase [Herbidospora galbida]
MTVGELGEFGVVSRISGRLPQGATVLLGPGDDAAILRAPDGRVVVTTDMLLEGRHFRRDWSSPYEIGRKAAAQNLSDISAMGAVGTGLFVGLGIPADLPVAWLDALIDGLRDECDLVGASLAGGDVTRSASVVLGVTALGDLQGRSAVLRSGARPGDVVAVAGSLGRSEAGLRLLLAGLSGFDDLVEAHRRPRPPYREGPRAAALGATAMLDVSDGLLQDLGHICAASGVAIVLDPVEAPDDLAAAAKALGADPVDWILTGGEDHALAATFPSGVVLPSEWRIVGNVAEGDGVQAGGRENVRGGWDHFRG